MSIEFKLSRDPQLLEQYFQLREDCFRQDLGLSGFDGSADDRDMQGQIFLVHQDGQCIGGTRISSQLPDPVQGYLNDLNMEPHACCIWERAVLSPAARTQQFFRDFCTNLHKASSVLGYDHALVLSTLPISRFYRQCHASLGVDFNIHRHVPECAQGAFADLEHYLSVVNLQKENLHGVRSLQIAA